MKTVYVEGIGILSPRVRSVSELFAAAETMMSDQEVFAPDDDLPSAFDFPLGVPSSKVRRAPRYAKLAVAAAAQAIEDAGLADDHARVGTIFTTGYGAVESNVSFADSVAEGVPALASPTVFSYTVPNSCLGQVCIVNGFQGPSTLLFGGDPIEYSALLLANGKARSILCGAVEEPTETLRSSFDAGATLPLETLSDGAVMLMLSAQPSDRAYARIETYSSVSLPAYPYVTRLSDTQEEEAVAAMTTALSDCAAGAVPELVLTAHNGGLFDAQETAAIRSALGDGIRCFHPKRIFGEALNCSYLENAALGAVILAAQRKHAGARRIKCLLAAGLDVHGNYLVVRMEG